MMDIQMRWVSYPEYAELIVESDNTTISSGLIAAKEARQLAKTFAAIASELLDIEEAGN